MLEYSNRSNLPNCYICIEQLTEYIIYNILAQEYFFIICNGNPSELCGEQSSDVSTNIAYGLKFKCLMSAYFMPT